MNGINNSVLCDCAGCGIRAEVLIKDLTVYGLWEQLSSGPGPCFMVIWVCPGCHSKCEGDLGLVLGEALIDRGATLGDAETLVAEVTLALRHTGPWS